MAIRVTQQTMYGNMVGQMQKNLGAYMESVQQGSTQKKINRPSDDPAGTYRVLTTRTDMTNTTQYKENVDTAKGWLNLADSVLSNRVSTAIQGLTTLAEQASTGTYDASQRKIMADQARQYFGQLLNLSNTEFEGKSIFGGHRYDLNAFEEGLAVSTWDEDWNKFVSGGNVQIEGASKDTVIVQFLEDKDPLEAGSKYRWSNNGGDSWSDECLVVEDPDGNLLLNTSEGVALRIPTKDADGKAIAPPKVSAADPAKGPGARNGTLLYIRPAAIYHGDDNDPPIDVTKMGCDAKLEVDAQGSFGKNMLLRFDTAAEPGKAFTWSYSADGGSNWVTARGEMPVNGQVRLPLPGGYADFKADNIPGKSIAQGSQIMIHPSRADLDFEIMKDTYLAVNSVGKDVFGGYYEGKPALDGDNNLFEVVGSFIGYLEGNNQEGCQKTLAALKVSEKQVLSEATRVGALENRVSMAEEVLSAQKLDQQERLSYVEDIDLTELLTKLTRQQLSYQTVLQSSSMIMQMSLAKYV